MIKKVNIEEKKIEKERISIPKVLLHLEIEER
jgi:hypothetical protein